MATRVLVVDDDPVQRRLIDAMLRRFGYEPEVMERGEEAVRLLESPEGAAGVRSRPPDRPAAR